MNFQFTVDLPEWAGIAIPALFGIAALVVVARMCASTRSFLNESVTTVGVVVRLAYHNMGSDEGTAAFPVVKFRTASGTEVEFESSSGGSPQFGKGEEVPVIYRPDKPQEAEIKQFWPIWGMPLLLGSLGAFSLLFALLGLAHSAGVPARVIGPVMFGLGGLGLFVAAILIYRNATNSLKNAHATMGLVVRTADASGLKGAIIQLAGGGVALIKFKAPSGAEIEFVAPPRSGGPAYRSGEQVPVFYDPTRPGSARVEKPTQLRRIAILMGICGIGIVFFSVWSSFIS